MWRQLVRTALIFFLSSIFLACFSTGTLADPLSVLALVRMDDVSCQRIQPLLDAFRQKGYPIYLVDVQMNPTTVSTYQIRQLPGFVFLEHGQPVQKLDYTVEPEQLRDIMLSFFSSPTDRSDRHDRVETSVSPVHNPPSMRGNHWPSDEKTEGKSGTQDRKVVLENGMSPFLAASTRLKVSDPSGVSYGTGTIIDVRDRKALIVTCGHIFRSSQGRGTVEVELCGGALSSQLPVLRGVCYHYNLNVDLAFVVVELPFAVQAIPMAAPETTLSPNMMLYSVGCDGGAAATVWKHVLQSTNRVFSTTNPRFSYIQVAGAPVSGRSGGGLFSENGILVGICNTGDPVVNDGHFVPIQLVYRELEAAALYTILKKPSLTDPLF